MNIPKGTVKYIKHKNQHNYVSNTNRLGLDRRNTGKNPDGPVVMWAALD